MPRLDVGPQLPGPFKDLIPNGIRQNSFTHPWNKPWTGNNGASVNNAYRIGRITAPAKTGESAINRFFFHYNPQSVTLYSNADPAQRTPDLTSTGSRTLSDITTNETLSFDFLLNRMPDVAYQQKWANDSAKAYGTLHDLYYLYGLINQNFGSDIIEDLEYPNTDEGLLQPNPLTVIFGELFRFYGRITEIDVQHAKFVASPLSTKTSAPLVPVLTTVSMSLARVNPGGNLVDDVTGGVTSVPIDPTAAGDPNSTVPLATDPNSVPDAFPNGGPGVPGLVVPGLDASGLLPKQAPPAPAPGSTGNWYDNYFGGG